LTHAPQSIDELCAVLAECSAHKRTVGLTGAGAPSGPAAVPVDAVVSTANLCGIVEYAPPDQIVTVEAGMTLDALAAVLAERKQRLALAPPGNARTTVGGLVASNAYGPLRTRFGTAKDLIVGMTIVRADGTRARGGGKVVKNVAGFDIPKLMVGTFGTLAAIATVTFRLHPLPHMRTRMSVRGIDAARVRALTRALTVEQLEPSSVTASFDGATYRYDIAFEGFERGVRAQSERFAELNPSAAQVETEDPADAAARSGAVVVKITAPPSELCAMHERAIAPLRSALRGAHACLYPVVGAGFVGGDFGDDAALAAALISAREWAEGTGGSLVLLSAPSSVRAQVDAWGTPPPSFPLMRALKDRFDPQRLFHPGGFVGGL
jgi:glycolate oxidase FAD binding subunit